MTASIRDLLRRAAALRREGRPVMGCLLVSARGSTPQSAGALMLVTDAAETFGTIGGGCVEAELRRRAVQMLGAGERGLQRFKLDHDYGWDDGLLCGGSLELAVAPMPGGDELDGIGAALDRREATALELIVNADDGPVLYRLHLPPGDRLYIAGAGHVGAALARLAGRLDFEVTLFDDRADLVDRAAAEAGCRSEAGSIADRLAAAPIDGATSCVVVTRGHRHDEQALEAVVGRGARYVGMIGSRRKVKLLFDDLVERGTAPEDLAPVRAPIGLDIGSVTVEEIALSIAAELVGYRRRVAIPSIEGPLPAPGAAGRIGGAA